MHEWSAFSSIDFINKCDFPFIGSDDDMKSAQSAQRKKRSLSMSVILCLRFEMKKDVCIFWFTLLCLVVVVVVSTRCVCNFNVNINNNFPLLIRWFCYNVVYCVHYRTVHKQPKRKRYGERKYSRFCLSTFSQESIVMYLLVFSWILGRSDGMDRQQMNEKTGEM